MIERRHPAPRKGERLVGYHPVPGRPTDAKGALQLIYQFASRIEDRPLTAAERDMRRQAVTLIQDGAGPIMGPSPKRSPLKVSQATLL